MDCRVAPLHPSNARFFNADEKIAAFVEIMRLTVADTNQSGHEGLA
jgi:hypothetical protein